MTRKNFSKKREAIYKTLCSTKLHPSAEWVYNNLKEEYPDLSLGTVYRNMNMFKEQGMAMSVGTVGGQERFDGNTKPHAHFICNKCGKITDIEQISYNYQADEILRQVSGCQVDFHLSYFYGVCEECRLADNEAVTE